MIRIGFQILLFCSFTSGFAANKTWTGATSSDWNTAGNWLGGLPANGDYYSSGTAPIIVSSSSFSPKDIVIQNGGTLTINSSLTVTGNITVDASSTLSTTDPTNGCIYFNGINSLLGNGTFIFPNIVINNEKTLNQNSITTINIKGNWTNNGGVFIPNLNKVVFTGTILQQINGTSTTQTFYDFEIAKTSQSLRISGNLTALTVHDFTQTSFKFHDSALSTFNVTGNFTHSSGTFVPCNNITISGNIIDNDNAPSTRLTWGTTVTLNGTAAQTISGTHAFTFNNLIINNTGSYGVTLQQPTSIISSLTLTNGIVYTTATNLLSIKNGATSTQGSAKSFVDGPIKKTGSSPFVFPVGNAGKWARIEMVNDAAFANYGSTTEFTCVYYKSGAPNNTSKFMSSELHHVSYEEYWNLERTYDLGNDAKCNVRLYWEDFASSGIGNLADLKVAHFSSSLNVYEHKGGTVMASGKTGNVTSTIPLTSFSPFTFGSASGLNPLPIVLLSFEAKITGNSTVDLIWNVASELNNDYYTIERSADGIYYEEIARIKGMGNCNTHRTYSTIDETPLPDICYYRLKQTDFDGKSIYYKPIHLELKENAKGHTLYPNPLYNEDDLFLKTIARSDKTIQLTILDVMGKTICSHTLSITKGHNQLKALPEDCGLTQGLYSVVIVDEGKLHYFRLLVN